jgi:hypothetical protein
MLLLNLFFFDTGILHCKLKPTEIVLPNRNHQTLRSSGPLPPKQGETKKSSPSNEVRPGPKFKASSFSGLFLPSPCTRPFCFRDLCDKLICKSNPNYVHRRPCYGIISPPCVDSYPVVSPGIPIEAEAYRALRTYLIHCLC